MNKKVSLPFALTAFALIFSACGQNATPINTYDPNRHYVSGTIHDINVNYSVYRNFIVNGGTDYYIASVKDDGALKIADYLVKQLKAATGVELLIRKLEAGEIVPSSEKAIIIGSDESFEDAGLTKTTKDISNTGYQLQTFENAVYLLAYGTQGFQLGGLKFLEIVVGYDLLYGDYIIYDRDGSQLPEMNVVERPDFDFRKIDDLDTSWRYGAGFTDNNVFGTIGGQQYHNSFKYISPDLYYDEHPNWYNTTYGKDEQKGQLCYTAHSHPEEIDQMVDIAVAKFIQEADNQPELENFTFTIQDNYNMCQCYGDEEEGWTQDNPDPNSCTGKKNYYNGSNAGITIEFVNKMDEKIQEHYKGTGRNIHLSIFAYHGTEIAPVKEVNGEYVAIEGAKVNDDVAVFCAFISSNFTNSFYDTDKNKDANVKAKSWMAVSDRLYSWIYETNFYAYFYPFNTFTSMCETYRFLKEHNNRMVYTQGQHTASNRTAFNKLKLYISSKLMIDVNRDVGEIIDKYFEKFYGEGASYMRQFYEEMVSWCEYQEVRWPKIFKGGVSSGNSYLETAEYWNEGSLNSWEQLCYKAVEQIQSVKEQDPYKYQLMENSIIGESIFPRWALCNLFASSYANTELVEKRMAFMEDARRLNFDVYGEPTNMVLADFYQGTWGL